MSAVIFWMIIFSLAGMGTTVLLGDRDILTGNMLSWDKLFHLFLNWKFILAMAMAFVARYSFMLINSNLLKNPDLASNSTSITALITLASVIIVVAGNAYFLGERLNIQQGLGAALIMIGTWVVLK